MDFGDVLAKYTDKTVLVTGGAGCIGRMLIHTLIESSAKKILILDDLSASYRWNIPKHESVVFVEGSVLDEQKLKQVFYERPNYVFHLAAHFANQNSIDHPETDLLVNGLGTLKVLEYARLTDPEGLFFASSGCSVYGSNFPIPFREDHMSLELDTPYQIHKLLGELYCNHYHQIYNLPISKGRFFNVYGPGEVPGRYRNVIPNFMWLAIHNKPLTITGSGHETRDFAFVSDIVDGMLRMGASKKAIGESINLASAKETTVKDLAHLIVQVSGSHSEINFAPKRKWDRSNRRLASIDKARDLLGFEPKMNLRDGLVTVLNWIKENSQHIIESCGESAGLW